MLKQLLHTVLVAVSLLGATLARAEEPGPARFRPLDVIVETDGKALAAYQIEVEVELGDAQIVGVEGGEHAAFKDAPFYDPAALMGGRIKLAAFSTAADLPGGAVRVCTLHLREQGPPVEYRVMLRVAAGPNGDRLKAAVRLEPRQEEEAP